jgi:Ca-activated chloride channel homolog
VTDREGRFVTGLTRADFRVYEDDKPQEIASFSANEAPFNVALLIDTSRSTRGVLDIIRSAAFGFIKQLQPQDRVLIVTFGEGVNFHGDFTGDRRQLQRTINGLKTDFLTSLYDAITRTINEKLSPLKGRKAIVIFSDGVDTLSRQATDKSTVDLVASSGVLVYAVQYRKNIYPGGPDRVRAEMERQRIATNFLRALAQQSGGSYLPADRIDNSDLTFALVADELRHQYMLEYYSTNDKKDGGYRAIAVMLKRDDLMVRTRPGYLAPKAETRINENQETKPPN